MKKTLTLALLAATFLAQAQGLSGTLSKPSDGLTQVTRPSPATPPSALSPAAPASAESKAAHERDLAAARERREQLLKEAPVSQDAKQTGFDRGVRK